MNLSVLEPWLVASAITCATAVIGGAATTIGPWYHSLRQPSWRPPDYAFGPVWTFIYICAVVAAVSAWNAADPGMPRRMLLMVFILNALLNALWSILFFSLRRPDWALIDILILWLSIVIMIIVVRPGSTLAVLGRLCLRAESGYCQVKQTLRSTEKGMKSSKPASASPDIKAESRHRNPESKNQHIDVCLQDDIEYLKTTGLESFRFDNQALPEVSLNDISLKTRLVGKSIAAPLMIAPMTGGNERGHEINRRLARAAERHSLAMGVGSQRLAIEKHERSRFYELRRQAPNAVLFANFGGAQLVSGWGIDEVRRAVDMIEANAIFIHLNPIQEAIQGGDVNFRDLKQKIADLVKSMADDQVPLFVREVCFGMSKKSAQQLIECGVAGIDCCGAGGTSWAKVESACAKTDRRRAMGQVFGEWGIPTADSIQNVRSVDANIPLIACGGLRTGLDLAKSLALGANVGAMARPFLLAAVQGDDAVDTFIDRMLTELSICMFGAGVENIDQLRTLELHET